jgi:hypothetical protein
MATTNDNTIFNHEDVEGSILNKPCPSPYRLYNYVNECETLLCDIDVSPILECGIDFEVEDITDTLELQSEEFRFFDIDSWNEVFDSAVVSTLLRKHDTVTKLIEDLLCLVYVISRARDKKDVLFACLNFLKLRCGDSSLSLKTVGYTEDIMCYITDIFSYNHTPLTSDDEALEAEILASLELQSDNFLDKTRSILCMYKNLRFGPLFKRCQKLIVYLTAFSLFKPLGCDLKTLGYTQLEEEVVKRKVWRSDEAIFHILETLQFLCERGYACLQTGSLDALFHSGSSYDTFYSDYQKIKKWHPMIGHQHLMDIEKITEHAFLALLDSCVERGESINKYVVGDTVDKKMVQSSLNELLLIRCHHLNIKNALQDRKAPFPILLYGDSGIGKTTLTNLLYCHFGKRRNQPVGDEYKYVKNPVAKYWDNFRSNMWCVVLDDIAFMNPNIASGGGDQTCMEMLQIVNNVPFVPDQASLDLKGKMPLKCELVIGTTNTPHLNAYYYFACPSAVQRRFPYILDVKVKPEYLNDANMLDSRSVPDNLDVYPDYWDWTVKKIKPRTTRAVRQDMAEQEVILDGVSLREFLKWYNNAIDEHFTNQAKSSESVENIKKVVLCDLCHLPKNLCECQLQSQEEISMYVSMYFAFTVYFMLQFVYYRYFSFFGRWQRWTHYCAKPVFFSWFWTKVFFAKCFPSFILKKISSWQYWIDFQYEKYIRSHPRAFWKLLGAKAAYAIAQPKFLCNAVLVLTACIFAYSIMSPGKDIFKDDDEKAKIKKEILKIEPGKENKNDEIKKEILESPQKENKNQIIEKPTEIAAVIKPQLQVNEGKVPEPKKEEPLNIWYNDSFELHQLDVGTLTMGWNQLTDDQCFKKLAYNCVYLYMKIDSTKFRRTAATCVGGQIYLLNTHFFKDISGDIEIKVGYMSDKQGVNANIAVRFNTNKIVRKPNSDICLIELRGIAPRADITELFCTETFDAKLNGMYLRRNFDGSFDAKSVLRIRQIRNHYDPQTECTMDVWAGLVPMGCSYGECGSLLYVRSGYGPVLLGIHYLGSEFVSEVRAMKVTKEFLKETVNTMCQLHIQGSPIKVDAPSVSCEIVDLHKKSAFRFLNEGSAQVVGSLTLPRAHGKSRVEKTPMNEYLSRHGYSERYTAPDLRTWKPWHLAAKEMVQPANKFKPSVLEACQKAFSADILSAIPNKLLKETVFVYDDFTAVNGAAGVTFVDKINRGTSMGHPYNRSKRFYINPVEARGENLDPVDFTDEVKQQIKFVEDNYISGKRYNTIFRANLKDEPVTFQKSELGKTRVFAGAPVAWSVVNRKYTLSLIRLIQSNQYIFECACGVICQSLEWDIMRKYLTQHGESRLVAGDFEKFDKRMSAELIQNAFDILIDICKQSGNYSHEDQLVLRGIAVDTAFAWMNFNGDLVSFFGSNPSGHPLTVIINSLVNSLYMRYCFTEITGKDPTEFKNFVNLMTYGDDNIMNVSEQIPSFNHTSIQLKLREVGVGYTMADKNAPSIPYINISECSFLKRTWRYDDDFGGYVAPLDHDSIEKMLMVWNRSKTISEQEQCIAVVSSAVMEYAYYGRMVFEDKIGMLKQMVRDLDMWIYVTEATFPTFSALVERYQNGGRKPTGASAECLTQC